MLPCQVLAWYLVLAFSLQYRPSSLLIFTACFAGAGGGSHNTGSVPETVKGYIPGSEANREARYEQGHDTGHDSSISSGGQGYGSSSANQGYNNSNTGSSTAGGGLLSYIPGTEANRESRAEQGQDPSTFSSGTTNSNTGGVMSHIPGTEANRASGGEHGQDSNRYSSTGNSTGTNTGGLMSYIPGTEANRESHAEHGQAASTGTVGTAAGMESANQQSPVEEAKRGESYGQSDTSRPLSSSQSRAPVSASTGAGESFARHSPSGAAHNDNHAQAYTGSGLSQSSTAPQLSGEYGSSAAPRETPEGTGHRVYGAAAESQGTGAFGKLKAAVGAGSGAASAPGAHSSWSTSQNPAFDSDTPRSGVGAPTAFTEAQPVGQRRSLSDVPPSASWGSSAQTASFAPTQTPSGKAHASHVACCLKL